MEGLTEKVTFEQRSRVGKGVKSFQVQEVTRAKTQRKSIPYAWEGARRPRAPGQSER